MLTRAQFLEPLAAHRTDEVMVTTMSVTRPWGRLSSHDLDFASADSAMGILAIITGAGATNLILVVVENGSYEVTGHQPRPGRGLVDFGAMARAAGFPLVYRFDDPEAWEGAVPGLLRAPGPTFAHVIVEPTSEGPSSRRPSEEARYLRVSLAAWARSFRSALLAGE